jgi:RNA polymerase sigma factor (sigma-70 family)
MGRFDGILKMHETTSETGLLQASLTGSTEAFGTIVQRYQSLICGITYSATGDFAKSRELAQETFISAWKGLGQLKDLNKFRSWLCTIARNLVSRSIREKQRDVISGAGTLESVGDVQSAEAGPVETAISREQQAVIWGALRQIPEQFREPMVLFYRQQQSIRQVAAGLGLSEDAAKQRLSRGRKLLKAEVASLVEDVLGRTGPKKAFTVAVIAALPALAPQAAAAGVAAVAAKGSPAAKVAFTTALSGAVLGPLLGLLGGLFGSWMSIKNAKSSQEKHFMIKCALAMWCELVVLFLVLGLFGLLAVKGVVPKKVFWVVFAIMMTVHLILLMPAILWANRRQRQIQKEQGTYVVPQYQSVKMSKANIYGAFGGSIFGGICWVIPISIITKDWLTAVVVLAIAGAIFIISAKKALRNREKYWRILIWDIIVLCALNLAVVNLRWNQWMPLYRQSPSYNRLGDIPLWGVNLMFIGVFGGLLLMFFLRGRKQQSMREEE